MQHGHMDVALTALYNRASLRQVIGNRKTILMLLIINFKIVIKY
jgi:hypothetical protein